MPRLHNPSPAAAPIGAPPSAPKGRGAHLYERKLTSGPKVARSGRWSSRIADNYRRRHRRPDTRLTDVEWRGAVLCAACGDVIGVYEPMIVITAGGARKTSRAREPELTQDDGILLHAHCEAPRRPESREQ